MSKHVKRILSLLLALVLCMGLGVSASASGPRRIDPPTCDDNSGRFILSANQGPYDVGEVIEVYVYAVTGNFAMDMFNMDSAWTYDKSYLRFSGMSGSTARFTVLRADASVKTLSIKAEYYVGSLYASDVVTVTVQSSAGQYANWSFYLSANQGPYDVGDTIEVYIVPTNGNFSMDIFNMDGAWNYNSSYLRFSGMRNSCARFTVIKADATARNLTIVGTYGVGSVDVSDYVSVTVQNKTSGVSSIALNARSLTLKTNESDRLSVSVYPTSAQYSVSWSSSNTSIVSVSSSGETARIYAENKSGSATITVTVTDLASRKQFTDTCTVKVEQEQKATYNLSATLAVGSTSNNAQLYEDLRGQFRSAFGVYPNDNSAEITFSRGSGSGVAALCLSNGNAATIGTIYSLAQFKNMYFDSTVSGSFSIPYSLYYDNKTLSGTIDVTIRAANIAVSAALSGNGPYTFNQSTSSGTVAELMRSSIQSALLSSSLNWSYLRFTTITGEGGTLYLNSSMQALTSSINVTSSVLDGLYLVPSSSGGVVRASFTVYNTNGVSLGTGTLNVTVPAAPQIDPSKLPPVTATPANMVGKVAGDYYYTDIVTTVNGTPIEAINIGGMTLINVEDLRTHGFSVVWDGGARTLRAARSNTAPVTGGAATPSTSGTVGARLGSYYYTDIVTYLDGYAINGYNTDGRTFICAEDMRYYGYSVIWNENARTLTVTSR